LIKSCSIHICDEQTQTSLFYTSVSHDDYWKLYGTQAVSTNTEKIMECED